MSIEKSGAEFPTAESLIYYEKDGFRSVTKYGLRPPGSTILIQEGDLWEHKAADKRQLHIVHLSAPLKYAECRVLTPIRRGQHAVTDISFSGLLQHYRVKVRLGY